MDTKEKEFIEGFKSYLSVEKNFSEHTLNAYCSDIVSFILWLNETSCIDVDFNKLRDYLHFIQRFDYKKTTIARKTASIRTFYKYLFRERYIDSNPAISLSAPKKPKSLPKFLTTNEVEKILNNIKIEICYSRTTIFSKKNLKDKFLIAFEIGETQKEDITHLAHKYLDNIEVICKKDMQERDRMIFIMNKKYPETQLINLKDLTIDDKTYKMQDILDAFIFSRDQLINETKEKTHGSHNELVGLNTKIKGLFAKVNTFEELPEYFLRFANENDLPIILIGNKQTN